MIEPEAGLRKTQTLFQGRVVAFEAVQVRMPTGQLADYEIIRHPGSAAIVAIDGQERVCLLRQFRPAAAGWIWELPAGRREPQEPPEQTARRELAEEAGCEARHWEPLGAVLSTPGICTEEIALYLATGLSLRAVRHEAYEAIEVHWVAFDAAVERALTGDIRDAKSVAGLLRAQALRSRR